MQNPDRIASLTARSRDENRYTTRKATRAGKARTSALKAARAAKYAQATR